MNRYLFIYFFFCYLQRYLTNIFDLCRLNNIHRIKITIKNYYNIL
jgi:hypothetical protein